MLVRKYTGDYSVYVLVYVKRARHGVDGKKRSPQTEWESTLARVYHPMLVQQSEKPAVR